MRSPEVVARRLVWRKSPQKALADRVQLLARAMSYGTLADLQALLERSGRQALAEALDQAPLGMFDRRSWRYWHLALGRPVPPLPVRTFHIERNRPT